MNKYFKILAVATVLFTSCQNVAITPDDEVILQQNDWKVSYFYDKDHEETSDFRNYSFSFDENGTFSATKNGETKTGTWHFGTDDSHAKLHISITGNTVLDELSDDWLIVNISDTKIELKDDNQSNQEVLHFSKL